MKLKIKSIFMPPVLAGGFLLLLGYNGRLDFACYVSDVVACILNFSKAVGDCFISGFPDILDEIACCDSDFG